MLSAFKPSSETTMFKIYISQDQDFDLQYFSLRDFTFNCITFRFQHMMFDWSKFQSSGTGLVH